MKRIAQPKTQLNRSDTVGYEAEPLEVIIERILATGSGIQETIEPSYSETYNEGMDIRTDKWDAAIDAKNKIAQIHADEKAKALAEKQAAEAAQKAAEANQKQALETPPANPGNE